MAVILDVVESEENIIAAPLAQQISRLEWPQFCPNENPNRKEEVLVKMDRTHH
ncbi:hypothetical protein CCACVL1_29632 [Corchorus capsularis]|uniref:Uncharacterized protein n=1 Tax=Corchorus capsularis TaxID=210143 RepID=A0A1R3G0X9_COCAP|nr:hypothetical protein CCACVL1_29632 [Corchorus capsularis]